MLLAFVGSVVLVLAAQPRVQFLRVNSTVGPPGALRMTLTVVLLGVFYFWGGVINARRLRFANYAPVTAAGRPKLRRAPHPGGFNLLVWQLMLCGWLALVAYPEQWTWPTVGLKTEVPIAVSAAVGFVAYGAFLALLIVWARLRGYGQLLDGTVRSMAALIPRGRGQKAMAWVALCIFNPVIEELLFRGVLVYQTALAVRSVWWPIAAGLIVNIGTHWYQGARSMRIHVPFYFIAVALLFSPLGLAGAIGFHVAGDVVPMLLFRQQLAEFRNRHRRAIERGSANGHSPLRGAH